MRRVVVGVVVGLLVAGCSRSPKPDPTPTGPLPTRVASSASALCGVDPDSLALASGFASAGQSGELVPGSGYCSVAGGEGFPFVGALLIVRIDPVDSEEGRKMLAQLGGQVARVPDVVYDDVVGAAWAAPMTDPGSRWPTGGGATVVWGDVVVRVDTGASAPGRDTAADLLALVRQVASSAGLGPYRASTSPAARPSP